MRIGSGTWSAPRSIGVSAKAYQELKTTLHRELLGKITAVHARRCGPCHKADEVSRCDWFDLRQPHKSRFLVAPLAKQSGGTGKCGQAVYKDQSDRDYQAVRGLVERAVEKAWQSPRRDIRAIADGDKAQRTAGR